MARESREVWAKRVEGWRESGLRANEFAAELGVNAATLAQWKYRLAAEAREKQASAPGKTPEPVAFVEVKSSAPAPSAAERIFELLLPSGIAVRVPADFDAGALRRLVDVMTAG